MKSIEQLLELRQNPYYTFTEEEQERLKAFLSEKQGQKTQAKTGSTNSEKNIPATVINKNIVVKETGEIPAMEEYIHPDAVQ